MSTRSDVLPVRMPGLRVVRWSTDELHTGLKETYSIARATGGSSTWRTGSEEWTSTPGSLHITQPGDLHRELSRDGLLTFQIITLPASMVENVMKKLHVERHLAANDQRGVSFQRLHDAVQTGAERLELEVALAEALAALANLGGDRYEHTRPVQRALELLRAQWRETVSLDALATHAGLDKFHLCRAFRDQVGLPPHAYLTRLRIVRARQLLETGIKASEVASQVGLYDQSQLTRHFRRIVGTTPGAYARAARGS